MQDENVLFLLNCHATPWQSHIHKPRLRLHFLDCSPPGYHPAVLALNEPNSTGIFHVPGNTSVQSEQDIVLQSPLEHLCAAFGGCLDARDAQLPCPDIVVVYNDVVQALQPFLSAHSCAQEALFWQNRLEGLSVLVYRCSAR